MKKIILIVTIFTTALSLFGANIRWDNIKQLPIPSNIYLHWLNPLTFSNDKIMHFGADRIEYLKNYDVIYPVYSLNSNNNLILEKNIKMAENTPQSDVQRILGLIVSSGFNFNSWSYASIPNSNRFVEIITTDKGGLYRFGTLNDNNTITWTGLKEVDSNFSKGFCELTLEVLNNNYIVATQYKLQSSSEKYYNIGKIENDTINWNYNSFVPFSEAFKTGGEVISLNGYC